MVLFRHSLTFAAHKYKINEWRIKRSQESHKKCSEYAANYQGNENGKCGKAKTGAGCHHPDEAVCAKTTGNAGQYCQQR